MDVPFTYELFFWIILLLATIYGIYKFIFRAYKKRWTIMKGGEQVKAKIINYNKFEIGEEPDKVVYYRCYLEFTTKAGDKVVVRPEEDHSYKFTDGTELTIYYLEKNPKDFVIKELLPFQTKALPFGFLILATSLYNIISLIFKLSIH